MRKIKKIFLTILVCIVFLIVLILSFSPLMFSNHSFLTRIRVYDFDESYTLGNAKNFGEIQDIYFIDFSLGSEPSGVLYESTYDGASQLEKCHFHKIAPFIWRLPNKQEGALKRIRIFAYEKDRERYYFLRKLCKIYDTVAGAAGDYPAVCRLCRLITTAIQRKAAANKS